MRDKYFLSQKKKGQVCNILQAIKVQCNMLRCTVPRLGSGMKHNSFITSVCKLICLIYYLLCQSSVIHMLTHDQTH